MTVALEGGELFYNSIELYIPTQQYYSIPNIKCDQTKLTTTTTTAATPLPRTSAKMMRRTLEV